MVKEITYESVIDSLKEKLPSLPQILEELVNKLSDPNSNLDNIEDLVEIDQAITTEILKVANKVEFTEPHEDRIVTIHDALHKIGFENAKRISLNVSVLKLMRITKFPRNFCSEQLWQHSLGVAVASAELAEFSNYENPDQAYTCGLIHDIGKLVKIKYSHVSFAKEIASAYRKNLDLCDVEKRRNLLRHDYMGYLMMKFWRMPGDLALTVKWHHTENREERDDVESPELHKLIDIVYFANVIINKLKIGYSGHTVTKELSGKFLRSFNLDEENLAQLESSIREKYEQSCPSLLLLQNE